MSSESKILPSTEDPDKHSENEGDTEAPTETSATGSKSSEKRKKKKNKSAVTEKQDARTAGASPDSRTLGSIGKLDDNVVQQVVRNTGLGAEIADMDPKKVQQMLKGMKLEDLSPGMVKNLQSRRSRICICTEWLIMPFTLECEGCQGHGKL